MEYCITRTRPDPPLHSSVQWNPSRYCELPKTNLQIKKMLSANNHTSERCSTSHKVNKKASAECIKLRKLQNYFGTMDDSQKLIFLLFGRDPFLNLMCVFFLTKSILSTKMENIQQILPVRVSKTAILKLSNICPSLLLYTDFGPARTNS